MIDISGQAVFVSGNAEDLGYAIASDLVDAGARVALIDDDAKALAAVAEQLRDRGGDVLPIEADFADAASTQAAADRALAHFGPPRALIHNAARFLEVSLSDLDFEHWRAEVDIILQSAFILSKAVWSGMVEARGGSIVYVSSGSALNGFADETAYVSGKHGQEGLMKVLALEGKEFDIAVNTMTTGAPIDGPLAYTYTDAMRKVMVKPSVLAPAFTFAAGFEAVFATGQRLNAYQLSQALATGKGDR